MSLYLNGTPCALVFLLEEEKEEAFLLQPFVFGIYVYALTQSGRYCDLQRAHELLAARPIGHMMNCHDLSDPWRDHAMAHTLYNFSIAGHVEIIKMAHIQGSSWNRNGGPFIRHHLWWHIGLTLTHLGDVDIY